MWPWCILSLPSSLPVYSVTFISWDHDKGHGKPQLCSLSKDWSPKYYRSLWRGCPPWYWFTNCDWIGFTLSALYLTDEQWIWQYGYHKRVVKTHMWLAQDVKRCALFARTMVFLNNRYQMKYSIVSLYGTGVGIFFFFFFFKMMPSTTVTPLWLPVYTWPWAGLVTVPLQLQ